ncbi:hypothetical protein C8F04DRAFT_1153611 [Mycena alexandri]|uniref:Uncharacterized protein n=1 Tax=Mycena alexandri TaxID=1745969 RepID=A0AAD6RZE8_9AGAR|nr:hypothetical protein C8F04DRAFT_1153611 [Mycena alexandri]
MLRRVEQYDCTSAGVDRLNQNIYTRDRTGSFGFLRKRGRHRAICFGIAILGHLVKACAKRRLGHRYIFHVMIPYQSTLSVRRSGGQYRREADGREVGDARTARGRLGRLSAEATSGAGSLQRGLSRRLDVSARRRHSGGAGGGGPRGREWEGGCGVQKGGRWVRKGEVVRNLEGGVVGCGRDAGGCGGAARGVIWVRDVNGGMRSEVRTSKGGVRSLRRGVQRVGSDLEGGAARRGRGAVMRMGRGGVRA